MSFVRMTEKQAGLLFGDHSKSSPARRPHTPKRREDLPENQVEAQINGFLATRGWVTIRQQVGLWVPWHQLAGKETVKVASLRPHRFGKKGMADWMAVRVLQPGADAQFFYFEVKASGKQPTPDQRFWLEQRAACGFLAAWFDDYDGGCPTSFLPWYRAHFEENV